MGGMVMMPGSGPSVSVATLPDNWDQRTSYTITVRIPNVGLRKRTITDGIVIEDVIVNMMRAYLYSITLLRAYDRPETPKDVRMILTRSWLAL